MIQNDLMPMVTSLYREKTMGGVYHWENSHCAGFSIRNKMAISTMVKLGGVYHWENSHYAGYLIGNKMAISTMVKLGGGFTVIKIAKLREIG